MAFLTRSKVQGLTVSLLLNIIREKHSLFRHYEDPLNAPPTYSFKSNNQSLTD